MDKVRRALAECDEDDEKTLLNVRKVMAEGWCALTNACSLQTSKQKMEDMLDSWRGALSELIMVYGDHMIFMIAPPQACTTALLDDLERGSSNRESEEHSLPPVSSASSTASGKSRNGPGIIAHVYRYLQNAKSVWTVLEVLGQYKSNALYQSLSPDGRWQPSLPMKLCQCSSAQVPEAHAVDGYKCFISVGEFYQLRTPFYQWFTKNFVQSVQPYVEEMVLSPGHVPVASI